MDIRQITPDYAVSPQISPEDCHAIAEAGFTAVICNRPDMEIPEPWHAENMRVAAEAAGLAFHVLPITHDSMTPDRIAAQKSMVAANDGPVLAYCASGTRCTVLWALGEAGARSADEILDLAGRAGYALEPLRPRLEQG